MPATTQYMGNGAKGTKWKEKILPKFVENQTKVQRPQINKTKTNIQKHNTTNTTRKKKQQKTKNEPVMKTTVKTQAKKRHKPFHDKT